MTTTRTPFFGTMRDLLIAFGIGIRNKLSKPYTHWPKQRHGVSAKGPWGRHRGSEFRGYRHPRAVGPGSYSEESPQQEVNRLRRERASAVFRADHSGNADLPMDVTERELRKLMKSSPGFMAAMYGGGRL